MAMFSDDDVAEIRRLSAFCTQRQLAARYGCGPYTISRILAGKRYGKPKWAERLLKMLPTLAPRRNESVGKKNLDELARRAELKLPLFDDDDRVIDTPGTRDGIRECVYIPGSGRRDSDAA